MSPRLQIIILRFHHLRRNRRLKNRSCCPRPPKTTFFRSGRSVLLLFFSRLSRHRFLRANRRYRRYLDHSTSV